MVFRNSHRHLSFQHHHNSSSTISPAFLLAVCYCLSSWLCLNISAWAFFSHLLVSCVPLTSSLQQNKQARQECSRQKGCFVFDLNTYIFFLVKTCDTHQTHAGRLWINTFFLPFWHTHRLIQAPSHFHSMSDSVWSTLSLISLHTRLIVSSSLLLCRVHKTTFSSHQTPAHAHSHRRHKHTRTATHTLAKALLLQGKLLSDIWDSMLLWQRWEEREARLGNCAVPSVFRDSQRSTAQVEGRTCPQSPHPICHAQTSTKRHLLASSHAQTLTALPESFSVALSRASFPLFYDCLSGPDHITVTVAMISAFSDRCICCCHSQRSSLASSVLPDLSQGSTTRKHGQRYLILLHAEDTILIENSVVLGDSTFK